MENKNFSSKKNPTPAAPKGKTGATLVLLNADHSGRDEMNLAGNPFALLQANSKIDSGTSIRYEWERSLPNGKMVTARWDVNGHAELGLPGPNDELLYLILMQLTREAADENGKWPEKVFFSRYEVLERLGWEKDSKGYKMLRDCLARLQSVSIQADHSFWNAETKAPYSSIGFAILDGYALIDEPKGRKSDTTSLPLSWFSWNETLHASFHSGNIRSLALDFVLSLDLPTSRRLFRFLDMMRYAVTPPRREFTIGVMKLRDRLGMTGYKYASKVKEKLVSAHEELIGRGYLSSVEYIKAKEGPEVAVYRFGEVSIGGEAEKPATEPQRAFNGHRGIDGPSEIDTIAAAEPQMTIFPQEAFAVWEELPEAEKERLRGVAREGIEPIFWDRLERPDSPMALCLWELVAAAHPQAYERELEK